MLSLEEALGLGMYVERELYRCFLSAGGGESWMAKTLLGTLMVLCTVYSRNVGCKRMPADDFKLLT